jgi:hypothetical protein
MIRREFITLLGGAAARALLVPLSRLLGSELTICACSSPMTYRLGAFSVGACFNLNLTLDHRTLGDPRWRAKLAPPGPMLVLWCG